MTPKRPSFMNASDHDQLARTSQPNQDEKNLSQSGIDMSLMTPHNMSTTTPQKNRIGADVTSASGYVS